VPSRSARSHAELVPLAALGVVAGHLITYAVAIPDARARAAFLAATGHGYFPAFAEFALVVAAVTVATALIGTVAGTRSIQEPWGLFRALAPAQAAGFVCLETLERALSRASYADLLRGDLLIGVAVQIALAGAVAWIVTRLTRVAASPAARLSHARPPGSAVPLQPFPATRPVAAAAVRRRLARAPPPVPLDA
jgi:hypothetical protein